MNNKWMATAWLLAMMLFCVGAQAAERLKVPVGISPVMSSAALFIGEEKGCFRDEGLELEINPFKASGAKMVPFLATGQLFVGGGNTQRFLRVSFSRLCTC